MLSLPRLATIAFVLSVSSSAFVGCATETSEPVLQTTDWHIRQGEVNKNDPNVMLLVHDSKQGVGLCSSSLIAPNLLLTARHCVSDTPEQIDCNKAKFSAPYAASTFKASTEYTVPYSDSKYIRATDVFVPKESALVCGYDVALVILKSNVPADKATPLIPRIKEEVAKGETYRAVGYGATDAKGSGAGTRRQRTNLTINCVGDACPFQSQVDAREWEGDTGICQGDSGGPALDTENRVIGVVSRGPVNGPVQCDSPTYGSVYKWEDFIVEVAKIAAEKGGYPLPEWAGGPPGVTPPPPTGAGGSGGGGGVIDEAPVYGVACIAPDYDCASGSCIEDRGFNYCSHTCSKDIPCPGGYKCTGGEGASFCTFVEYGVPCGAAPDYACDSGTCIEDRGMKYCSNTCSKDVTCPDRFTCTGAEGAGLCTYVNLPASATTPAPTADSGDCSVGAVGASGRDPVKPVPWVVGAAAALAFAARRRRGSLAVFTPILGGFR